MSLTAAIERIRQADTALAAQNPKPFPVPATGLEPLIAGAVLALGKGDWWVPGLRERVGAVLRDVPIERLVDAWAGARPYKVAPATPSPALRALHAVGIAMASERTTLVHLGIGSAADGAFHEAVNTAAMFRPNIIFLVAVTPLGDDAPVGGQLATEPVQVALSFGLDVVAVDGSDASAVHDAVAAAKAAGGPHLIQADLPRTSP